jgi:hypothetical protein
MKSVEVVNTVRNIVSSNDRVTIPSYDAVELQNFNEVAHESRKSQPQYSKTATVKTQPQQAQYYQQHHHISFPHPPPIPSYSQMVYPFPVAYHNTHPPILPPTDLPMQPINYQQTVSFINDSMAHYSRPSPPPPPNH